MIHIMMTGKTKFIAIIALAYIIVTGAGLGWVEYEVFSAGKALTERVSTIADKNARAKAYRDLFNLVSETKNQRETLSGFVLTEEKTSEFLTDIEGIGASQGITLTTDSLRVDKQDGSFDLLQISFTMEGDEGAIEKMLTIFETLPYHSQVSSLSYVRTGEGKVRSTLGLEVSLSKYVQ